ncbi:MAG: biotin--[acetyl-CoA-carboxylase] ligase [Proteobacteria bacterium]|nr:biotin--[acetyl-CoA-carboxylase] ligase [Pseudomonadota bacterium]
MIADANNQAARATAMPLAQRVFQRLSDAAFRSGEELAAELDVTRAAVWKAVEQLRDLGVPLEAQPNRGYRLAQGYAPLDRDEIVAALAPDSQASVHTLEVVWSLPSTNDYLLALPPPPPGQLQVVLTELQTAGRGRRGRAWVAPPGGAICLSMGWAFAELPQDISALALVIGICAQRSLARCDIGGVRLKWPNDLVTHQGKLGGILLELRAEASGPAYVVIGIGLNAALSGKDLAAIAANGGNAVDLRSLRGSAEVVTRNRIVSVLLEECAQGLAEYESVGLAAFLVRWQQLDAIRGTEVSVTRGDEVFRGVARGIDSHGQLLLEVPGGVQAFASGEVSVRAAPGGVD